MRRCGEGRERRLKKTENVLHQIPNPWTRKGIPFQQVACHQSKIFVKQNNHQVFDAATANRDCSRALHVGEADQDLVWQQKDEVEEGAQDGFGGSWPGSHGDAWTPSYGTWPLWSLPSPAGHFRYRFADLITEKSLTNSVLKEICQDLKVFML